MTFRALCCVLLLSVVSATGCGTMANLAHSNSDEGGRIPFGGVKRDMAAIHNPSGNEPGPITHRKRQLEQYPHEVLTFLCAVDLPFSLVGDLLTWGYTSAYTTVNAPVPVPPVTFAASPVTLPPTAILATLQPPAAPMATKPTSLPPMPQPMAPPRSLDPLPEHQPKPAKLP